jgi:hypothetical protein
MAGIVSIKKRCNLTTIACIKAKQTYRYALHSGSSPLLPQGTTRLLKLSYVSESMSLKVDNRNALDAL